MKEYVSVLTNALRRRLEALPPGQRMLELCAFILCLLFPLCPEEVLFEKFPVRIFLFALCLILTSLALFLFRLQKSFSFKRGAYRFDLWIAVISLCLLGHVAFGVYQGRPMGIEIVCLMMAGLYYLFSYYRKMPGYLTDLLLFSGGLFLLVRILSGFAGTDGFFFSLFYQNPETLDMAMLLSVIASAGFCTELRGWKSGFYMTAAVIGFAAILMEGSIIVNLALLLVLAFLVLCFPATASNLKRGISLCFVFLFLWSNMSLLKAYIPALKELPVYTLEDSIYLDLFLCAAGFCLVRVWERLPENCDRNSLVMTGLKKRWISICTAAGGLFVFFLGTSAAADGNLLKGRMGEEMWIRFHSSLQTAGQSLDGLFQVILRNFGIAGLVFLCALLLISVSLIRRQFGLSDQDKKRAAVYFAACLWMFLFIAPSPATVPYMILFMTALLPEGKNLSSPQQG